MSLAKFSRWLCGGGTNLKTENKVSVKVDAPSNVAVNHKLDLGASVASLNPVPFIKRAIASASSTNNSSIAGASSTKNKPSIAGATKKM